MSAKRNIKDVNNKLLYLTLITLTIAIQSCATVGNSQTDTDFSIYPRFYVDEYVEILRAGYFPPAKYWAREEPKRKLLMELKGSDKNFRRARAMKYMMTEDVEAGRYEYYKVYFEILPNIQISVNEGAFEFTVASKDSLMQVRDRGVCVMVRSDVFSQRSRVYWDSGECPFLLHDGLAADRPPGWPVPAYVRLPAWVEEGELKELRVDPELWRYSGPGVKEKPQWK